MTPPPPQNNATNNTNAGANAGTKSTSGGGQGAAGGTSGTQGATGTQGTQGTKTHTNTGTSGASGRGTGTGTGTIPKSSTPGANSQALGTLAQPLPPAGADGVLQITPAMLQQLLASAVAASSNNHREPPVPKFWESEPAAWFQVFRGHYRLRNLSQLDLFTALLPLVPASAVALCRPYVGSTAPDVFDQVERLLLQRFEMSPMERGKALIECTSLGDRTPEEMLQHMRSLQPGEPEGVMFRYVFVSLLPDVVREVVTSMDSLDDMARTANNILQSNASGRLAALTLSDSDQVAAVRRPSQRSFGRNPPRTSDANSSLCRTHARYGQDAFRCDRPSACPMRGVVRPSNSGNGPAGRH